MPKLYITDQFGLDMLPKHQRIAKIHIYREPHPEQTVKVHDTYGTEIIAAVHDCELAVEFSGKLGINVDFAMSAINLEPDDHLLVGIKPLPDRAIDWYYVSL